MSNEPVDIVIQSCPVVHINMPRQLPEAMTALSECCQAPLLELPTWWPPHRWICLNCERKHDHNGHIVKEASDGK